MKTFKIKIDKKSIKKNPKAGETSDIALIHSEVQITIKGDEKEFEHIAKKQKVDVYKTSFSVQTIKPYIQSVYFAAGDLQSIGRLVEESDQKYKGNLSYSITNSFQEVRYLTPIPSHTFKYLKTKVQCQHCKAKFTHDKLYDVDNYDYEENYVGKSNVCPKCHLANACILEFEDFNDVLLQKAKVPRFIGKSS